MRTILLLGVAAGSLLLSGHVLGAEMPGAEPQNLAQIAHGHDPQPRLDYGTPTVSDARVYTGYHDRVPSEVDYRRVRGSYDAEGRWTGTWDGTYEAPDGRRYDGSYQGTVEGAGTHYPPPPYDRDDDARDGRGVYDVEYHADMERRCGRGGTATGAVVGGVVGGVAGNRIAGKGDRTAGTVLGGAAGAIAGAAIGSASDRANCEQWARSRRTSHYQGGPYPGGYHHDGYYRGGHGGTTVYQQGGYGYYGAPYGYYTPGVVVTTVITTGAPVVTETVETSTRTYYEKVPVRKRHVAKKKWKPKPKPRCVC